MWGEEGEEKCLAGGWATFEEVDYEQVRTVALKNIEHFSNKLFYSSGLMLFNLKKMNEVR